jgi:hypothetical protein
VYFMYFTQGGNMKNIKNKEKNSELRKQITDVLRYLRKDCKGTPWIYGRVTKEVHLAGFSLSGDSPDVVISGIQRIVNEAHLKGIHISDIKCYANYEQDIEDGYETSEIVFNAIVKQTDEEYFDALCEYLLPSDYQLKQYNEYIRLKKIFEN